ncbi:MAG: LacI family DNA-binding transcriptional regulator [Verrucomicrobiota bacterium JB024]|nr:LacI family DNA-binding transcriptional regulator [Verrucomicrobiota bacterium JB024]
MVTLKNVAEEAGVSVRTVSVVLNGKATEGRISKAIEARILKIAAEMDYRPNAMARATRTRRTLQIGVLVRELSNPNTGRNIEMIGQYLQQRGYKILLGLSNGRVEVARAYLSDFLRGMVDGILNMEPALGTADFRKAGVRVPYVHLQRRSPGFNLRIDWEDGVRQIVNHFAGLGHRTFGFISGPAKDPSSHARLRGFERVMKNHPAGAVGCVRYGDWSLEAGLAHMPELRREGCTAVIGANDMMAIGAIRWAHMCGLSVPGDFSVAGFDDTLSARLIWPSLTSVNVPMPRVAELSVEALVNMIEGKPGGPAVLMPMTLCVRDSSGPCPASA